MTILSILQYPDPRLHRKARRVTDVKSPVIQQVINDMVETLLAQTDCAGLAATQLNLENPPNITVFFTVKEQPPVCLINPEIIQAEGEVETEEGCMSIYPQTISAKIKRFAKVKVKALNRDGEEIIIEGEEFLARCLQHEIDHLNGTLYVDRLSPLKHSRLDKKIAKLTHRK
jgi:peptide deformylase